MKKYKHKGVFGVFGIIFASFFIVGCGNPPVNVIVGNGS